MSNPAIMFTRYSRNAKTGPIAVTTTSKETCPSLAIVPNTEGKTMFNNITMIDYAKPLAERAKSRKFCGPYRWTPSKPNCGRGFYQHSRYLCMDKAGSSFELRLDYAHTHIPSHEAYRLPTAYWADVYGDAELTPIIARLPHGRGFLAGWTMGNGMCASLDADIYETEYDAALAAYSIAEQDAENMRDEQGSDDEY